MSKVEELLKAHRQAQIARLEGRPSEVDEEELTRRTKKIVRATEKEARRERINARRTQKEIPRARLFVTKHARTRMSQRGLRMKEVSLMWKFGECLRLNEAGRTAHVLSDSALSSMPRSVREKLQRFRGAAIIVQEDDGRGQPALVTVLADGEDTYFG